jgi:heme exporter protein A
MLEVINLECVRGDRTLFKDLNFKVAAGELIELRGANGSGKTSLLRILGGLAAPAAGAVRWQGKNIRKLSEEYFAAVAYLGHQNGVKSELSAIENLSISSGLSGRNLSKDQAQQILVRVGLSQYAMPTRFLSAGQRRRVGLARLLSSMASLWLLDEVLTSLDEAAVNMTRDLISEHLEQGGMAIIATHQELNLSRESYQRIQLSE